MTDRLGRRLQRDETGAYATMFVIVLVVFVGLSAIVVDLGSLYFTRHNSKAVADMAATAGGLKLEPTTGGTPADACQEAWTYVLLNLPDAHSGNSNPPNCGAWSPDSCDPADANRATGVVVDDESGADLYTVTITWPVPADDPSMDGRETPVIDGESCLRIGVDIRRHRGMLFAGFGGGPADVTMGGGSVSRAQASTDGDDVVSLVVLDRTDCYALQTGGQAQVVVESIVFQDDDGNDVEAPGAITVDSDGLGACGPSQPYAIAPGSGSNTFIEAEATDSGIPGIISSHALLTGGSSHNASDCGPNGSGFKLRPCPVGGDIITRAPIDWRYNCKQSYPFPSDRQIAGCPRTDDDSEAYVDQLEAALGTPGATPPASPYRGAGGPFQVYPRTTHPSDTCNIGPGTNIVVPSGNWFIDCPNPNPTQQGFRMNGGSFTIGAGQIVFRGGINIGGGSFSVGNSSQDSIVFVRSDTNPSRLTNLLKGGSGQLDLQRTHVHLNNGRLDTGANDGPIVWTAPTEDNDDVFFEDLALWSEHEETHELGGQADLTIVGTFFTPNADAFEFTGQAGEVLTGAQFVSWRLVLKGQGDLRMIPDPQTMTLIPVRGVRLIR